MKYDLEIIIGGRKMYNMIQKNRENGKKGFTLAELLVVVAIIAVLVAISIPIFTAQLNKAKEATDAANLRAAKGAAVTQYLSSQSTDAVTYYYDADNGKAYADKTKVTCAAYNKADQGAVKAGTGIAQVAITANGDTATASWVAK